MKYKLHPNSGVYDENGNYIAPKKGDEAWELYMAWFRDGNTPDPPDQVVEYIPTLEEVKSHVMKKVDQFAARIRMQFLQDISPAEMASWSTKEKLAKEYVSTTGASDPGVLLIEAQTRGISLDSLIEKILTKAELYYQLEGVICGLNGKHNDAIKLLPTIEDVANYDYTTGWPTP